VSRHLIESRSAAQRAIDEGRVRVAGVAAPKSSTLVARTDPIRISREEPTFVGRGGTKLAAALEAFMVDVADRSALDVGASTGGFTDCLLQSGAKMVVAVDVGYGQLHWRLRNDERVHVIERTNFRTVDIRELGGPFDVIVADLSFISLRTVAAKLAACGGSESDWVLLVKPQFEVGKRRVPRGGVVKDPSDRAEAVRGVRDALAEEGIGVVDLIVSPITGAEGNVEFLVHGRRGFPTLSDGAVAQAAEVTT